MELPAKYMELLVLTSVLEKHGSRRLSIIILLLYWAVANMFHPHHIHPREHIAPLSTLQCQCNAQQLSGRVVLRSPVIALHSSVNSSISECTDSEMFHVVNLKIPTAAASTASEPHQIDRSINNASVESRMVESECHSLHSLATSSNSPSGSIEEDRNKPDISRPTPLRPSTFNNTVLPDKSCFNSLLMNGGMFDGSNLLSAISLNNLYLQRMVACNPTYTNVPVNFLLPLTGVQYRNPSLIHGDYSNTNINFVPKLDYHQFLTTPSSYPFPNCQYLENNNNNVLRLEMKCFEKSTVKTEPSDVLRDFNLYPEIR